MFPPNNISNPPAALGFVCGVLTILPNHKKDVVFGLQCPCIDSELLKVPKLWMEPRTIRKYRKQSCSVSTACRSSRFQILRASCMSMFRLRDWIGTADRRENKCPLPIHLLPSRFSPFAAWLGSSSDFQMSLGAPSISKHTKFDGGDWGIMHCEQRAEPVFLSVPSYRASLDRGKVHHFELRMRQLCVQCFPQRTSMSFQQKTSLILRFISKLENLTMNIYINICSTSKSLTLVLSLARVHSSICLMMKQISYSQNVNRIHWQFGRQKIYLLYIFCLLLVAFTESVNRLERMSGRYCIHPQLRCIDMWFGVTILLRSTVYGGYRL